jgi:Ca2+-binding RTX toxin-like protein
MTHFSEALDRLMKLSTSAILIRAIPRHQRQSTRRFSWGGCDYVNLERRQLLANVVFNDGILSINGTTGVDTATLTLVSNGSAVRVNASGAATQDFTRSQVREVVFIGLGGDDFFNNQTDVPSRAFGQNGNDTLLGGSGQDTLVGGAGSDELRGNGGNDIIRGSNGGSQPDLIFGGDGNDRLFGGTGTNTINGGDGNDVVFGGSGIDNINGGDGNDELFAGAGNNTVRGGNGDDFVIGGTGIDTVFGEAGVDRIFTLGGNDVVDGGTGNDTLFGGQNDDSIVGGSGNDTIRTGPGQDRADGGVGDDLISGFQGDNVLDGGSGNDRIFSGSGDDTITGGDGNDVLVGQSGDDTINGGRGDDFIIGDVGDDHIRGGSDNDIIFGSAGDDFLDGGNGNDEIAGQAGNDQLFGASGNDRLVGGDGLDGLSGGSGQDDVIGGNGADRFLSLSGDTNTDIGAADALINLRNGTSRWNNREIEVIDEGFRKLHIRTGSTRVLKDSLDSSPLTIFKEAQSGNEGESGSNQLQNEFTFTAQGQLQSETFTRRIEIAEWDESDDRQNEFTSEIVIHEIAHSWDSTREINENFAGQGSIWTRFLALSRWRTSSASGFTQSSTQTTEPFDLEFNASNQTFTQVVNTWYFRNGSSFARDYGGENPQEDWATVWEAALSENPEDREGISAKVAEVNRLFDLL